MCPRAPSVYPPFLYAQTRLFDVRAKLLEGYICALRNLDEFIRIIRGSRNREEAKVKLLAFEWTRPQVEAWGYFVSR